MRGRPVLTLAFALASMLPALRPRAFALDPKLDVNQYAHTAWSVREGFSKGAIWAIAQTPDGYLWLGTEYGLLRFDGVRNVLWRPPPDQHLPSNFIDSLLVARDGTLWIGTWKGLASWKDGRFTVYAEFAGQIVFKLLADREGTLWVGTAAIPTSKLCSIRSGSVQCSEANGRFGDGVYGLYEDSKGNLWVGIKNGLCRWKPGAPQFYALGGAPEGIHALGEDEDGALLVGMREGIRRFANGKISGYLPLTRQPQYLPETMLRDRDGSLWIATPDRGLVHVHDGKPDSFAVPGGLSGNRVYALFEDREGNVWASTINGLDRFRDSTVATYSVNQGLSNATVVSALATNDGSVWLATLAGLDRWKNGLIRTVATGKHDGKLNGFSPESLFQDTGGRIWVSTVGGIGYMDGDRFIPLSSVPAGRIPAIAQGVDGSMWIAHQDRGLFRLLREKVVQQIPWTVLGHKDPGMALVTDAQGGMWIGFFQGGVAYLKDGRVRASFTDADGLADGRVLDLRLGPRGTLWVATEAGLSLLKNGRIATLSSKNGLPCDGVHWTMEDNDHFVWMYTTCGLVRVGHPELDAWIAGLDRANNAAPMNQATVLDSSDGVKSRAVFGFFGPEVAKSSDGRLWFLPFDGVSVVDPHNLHLNKLPPPVQIEQITADRKTFDATFANANVRLPPLVRDLQIDYTALSLVAPEKVLFRYKLEGWDRDWQDAGNRRQAFYGNLPPRNYRFRVIACNNSGVWNNVGTFLDFSVAPAYYQTLWFRLACVFVFLALLAALYRLRVRQLAGQFNMRLDERVNERTRIARDLHDTMLQSFQGLMLKFRVLAFLLPDRPAEAQKMLEEVIEQARAAITEGRDAVHGLRSSALATNDLAQAIGALGEQLNASQTGQESADFCVHVEGAPRKIVPLLRDDVYRIASEALRNAFHHSHPRKVEVEIRYDQRQFRLRVRDDGKGIDPTVLSGDGQPGHYGLPGMHERAKLIGGKLEVWSELDSGTEVELTLPASLAYVGSPGKRRFLFRSGSFL